MKRWAILLLIAVAVSCGTGRPKEESVKQEFEGRITYLISVKSKSAAYSTKDLQGYHGDTMILYYKRGKTRMSFNGNDLGEIYYSPENNKEYTLRNGQDTILRSDCSRDKKELVESYLDDETAVVLGRNCKKWINKVGEVRFHYWFDPNIYIDPEHHKKRGFGYVNVYYENSQAMWLKYFYEGKNYEAVYEAIKIEEMALPDSTFLLPVHLPIKDWEF